MDEVIIPTMYHYVSYFRMVLFPGPAPNPTGPSVGRCWVAHCTAGQVLSPHLWSQLRLPGHWPLLGPDKVGSSEFSDTILVSQCHLESVSKILDAY